MGKLSAFWDDERGVTTVEYGVMLLILAICIVALTSIGSNLNLRLQSVATKFQ